MVKCLAKINRKIGNFYWNRYFAGKLKPIESRLYHFHRWLFHFVPYEWLLVGDEDDNICESKEDELWVADNELWTADDVIWTVNAVDVNDDELWIVDTDAIWAGGEELEELWTAVEEFWHIEA